MFKSKCVLHKDLFKNNMAAQVFSFAYNKMYKIKEVLFSLYKESLSRNCYNNRAENVCEPGHNGCAEAKQ